MLIRNIIDEDIIQLAALYRQFWNEGSDTAMMQRKFIELQNNHAYILLCAEENGELLGSVMGIVCEELYGECRPFLVVENMVVDKNCRKKGIGKLLFYELEKQAKAKGCVQIILVTEANRPEACGFYESIGFHPSANRGYKKNCNALLITIRLIHIIPRTVTT